MVMSLIDNVELYMPANSEIINIMLDEMESYFAGGKSKEATVAVIQDRVQLYLDERN